MIARTSNGQDRRTFGAGILDPAHADPGQDWQPADADAPAEIVPTGPDPDDLAGPRLTLPEWVESQADQYRRMGSDAELMLAAILGEVARSIRFYDADRPAEYLERVAIVRSGVEHLIPEDLDADNPLW